MGMEKLAVTVLASILILGGFGLTQQASANVTSGLFSDDALHCDPFPDGLGLGDELGIGFPTDELITAQLFLTGEDSACPLFASGPFVGTVIEIVNMTTETWQDLIYVADEATTISNWDGFVDGSYAFKVDNITCEGAGATNNPLLFESGVDLIAPFGELDPGTTTDCLFSPTELWEINIDDYFSNESTPPENINSLGLVSVDTPGFGSSGSIFVLESLDSGPPPPGGVGGTLIPIETVSVMVAGAQTTTPWMILGAIAAVGVGLAVFAVKRNR